MLPRLEGRVIGPHYPDGSERKDSFRGKVCGNLKLEGESKFQDTEQN